MSSLGDGDPRRGMAEAAAALWCAGVEVDWAARSGPRRKAVAAPHYPFQRKTYWMEIGPIRLNRQGSGAAVATPTNEERTMPGTDGLLADLIAIVSSVSGYEQADITVGQPLMDMGLDSLMLLKVSQAVERRFGVELRASQLFKELATLTDLAAYLEVHGTSTHDAGSPPGADPSQQSASQASRPPVHQTSSVGADPSTLFERQLQAMTQLAAQNLQSLTDLARHQLAAAAGPIQAEPAPERAATPARSITAKAAPARAPRPVADLRGFNLAGARLTPRQQSFVDALVSRHVERTGRSKAMTGQSRAVLADWKQTLSFWGQLKEAKYPIVSAGSDGARITDVDGNIFIDVAMGMGVHFFGHNPEFLREALHRQMEAGLELGPQSSLTGEAARLLAELTGTERVAFSNTGSEAVMVALRLARAATGRTTIVLFKEAYHGIFDGVLATRDEEEVVPVGLGTPHGMIEDVVVLTYGSSEALATVEALGETLAAILVEPVQSRNPDLQPQGFLKALRRLATAAGAALVFDEMINGFRVDPGGAQAWFGVEADIVLYGKIVGGGMPIGVIAGRARFLDYIDGGTWTYGDRSGPGSALIYFGGTFCRNPATMATTLAALQHIKASGPALQSAATALTTSFCDRLNRWFEHERVPLRAGHFSSQWRLVPAGDSSSQPIELELLYLAMMIRGVYTWERRISFFSTAHTQEDVDAVFAAITGSIAEIRDGGFAWSVDRYPHPQFAPLFSTQRRLFALSQSRGGELAYHLPQAFLVEGALDIGRLEEAFRTIIARHESLRTAFVTIDGEPSAKLVPEPRFAIERVDYDGCPVEAVIQTIVRPFDLSVAPLVRVVLANAGDARSVLLIDAHHIVIDGQSFDIVGQELMAAYAGRELAPMAYDLRQALLATEAGG